MQASLTNPLPGTAKFPALTRASPDFDPYLTQSSPRWGTGVGPPCSFDAADAVDQIELNAGGPVHDDSPYDRDGLISDRWRDKFNVGRFFFELSAHFLYHTFGPLSIMGMWLAAKLCPRPCARRLPADVIAWSTVRVAGYYVL